MKRAAEWGDVISYVADRNFRYGLNPDVEEVLEMNQLAKERECPHPNQSTIYDDDSGSAAYSVCRSCTKVLPPVEAARRSK